MSEMDISPMPPISPEQWLDLVIACASHRSHDEAQRKFGELLVNRYFTIMPERYAQDTTASAYFDEMLCSVASAIRGFSVVRDMLQTNWETLKNARDREVDRAKRLDAYSPFNKDGYWHKLVGIFGAVGFSGFAMTLVSKWLKAAPIPLVLGAVFLFTIGLFGFEFLIDTFRNRRLKDCEARFPKDLLDFWEEKSMRGYRMVARQFLPLAIEISNRHYPDSHTSELSDDELDELVERHFAFKARSKPE